MPVLNVMVLPQRRRLDDHHYGRAAHGDACAADPGGRRAAGRPCRPRRPADQPRWGDISSRRPRSSTRGRAALLSGESAAAEGRAGGAASTCLLTGPGEHLHRLHFEAAIRLGDLRLHRRRAGAGRAGGGLGLPGAVFDLDGLLAVARSDSTLTLPVFPSSRDGENVPLTSTLCPTWAFSPLVVDRSSWSGSSCRRTIPGRSSARTCRSRRPSRSR